MVLAASLGAVVLAHASHALANPIFIDYDDPWMIVFGAGPDWRSLWAPVAVATIVAVAVEMSVAALARVRGPGLLAVGLLNLVTAPAVNLALRSPLDARELPFDFTWSVFLGAGGALLLAELAVVFVETVVLLIVLRRRGWTPTRVLALVLVANVASYGVGLLIRYWAWFNVVGRWLA